MYIATHRVRDAEGREGINAFLHLHGDIPWPERPWELPEQEPGRLIYREIGIAPGGNYICSRLDVIAPDACLYATVEEALHRFWYQLIAVDLAEEQEGAAPLMADSVAVPFGEVTLRFGLEAGRAGRALHFAELQPVVLKMLLKR